jgi:hypothetical protein
MGDFVEDHVRGGLGSASEGEGAEEQDAVEVSAEKPVDDKDVQESYEEHLENMKVASQEHFAALGKVAALEDREYRSGLHAGGAGRVDDGHKSRRSCGQGALYPLIHIIAVFSKSTIHDRTVPTLGICWGSRRTKAG